MAKAIGGTQPIEKRKPKAKTKPEIAPAPRISGVGAKMQPVVLNASEVTLSSLAVGNGGARIRLSDHQAASVLTPR